MYMYVKLYVYIYTHFFIRIYAYIHTDMQALGASWESGPVVVSSLTSFRFAEPLSQKKLRLDMTSFPTETTAVPLKVGIR